MNIIVFGVLVGGCVCFLWTCSLWMRSLKKWQDSLKKERDLLSKEEKELRQTYVDSIKDVYDLIELLLKTKEQYQFDPEIKKSFDKLSLLQTTLYETLVKLEICELGMKLEVIHEDGPRSKVKR